MDVFFYGSGFHPEDHSYLFVRLRFPKPGQHQQFARVEQSFLDDLLFQNDAHRSLPVAIEETRRKEPAVFDQAKGNVRTRFRPLSQRFRQEPPLGVRLEIFLQITRRGGTGEPDLAARRYDERSASLSWGSSFQRGPKSGAVGVRYEPRAQKAVKNL